MQTFTVGQRWVSDNDAALGLGIVKSVDFRTVQIEYPAADEIRTYARDNAPLTRVEFVTGDTIQSVDGWKLNITHSENVNGTLRYHGRHEAGQQTTLHECELCDEISFNLPQEKLFAGQIDDRQWFTLRAASLRHLAEQQASPSYGLHAPRVNLLAHQIYIADEVSRRLSPRVLLADEVGLGKTIEAGLILHRLLITGKIQRALVIVPEPLLHQWLVELLRRFNLRFTLIDDNALSDGQTNEQDIDALLDDTPVTDNPFALHPLVLCGLDFACRESIAPRLTECNWDMLIVDEAHHLQWSPQHSSREYQQIETLANSADSVLLLTATPEQLGAAGHFARLRLLDPARFHSLDGFLAEEQQHKTTAELADALLGQKPLCSAQITQLQCLLDNEIIDLTAINRTDNSAGLLRQRLIDALIDRHGTGRVLFRNTRAHISATISQFPQRRLVPAVLSDDSDETRTTWLAEKLRALMPHKALLICQTAKTTQSLAKNLLQKHGLQASIFHQHMSIIERDRAAAWFADAQEGARILICSEIGSEGRNFQFLHHIILFDLPDNPDLLEQRIGRLDRIGQQRDICIHVPTAVGSRDHRLYRWYHQALDAFEQSCVTGQYVKQQMAERFDDFLAGVPGDEANFIQHCKQLHQAKMAELDAGRNRLLELNACRKHIAQPLIENIDKTEQNDALSEYLEAAFDCYGVEMEDHSAGSWVIRPGDHLQVEQFPELPEDGITATTRRDIALAREDMQFLTWEHPMVRATLDLVLNGDRGSVSVCALKMPQLPARTILLEALFEANCPAPAWLQVPRYLPHNALRCLLDQRGRDFAGHLPESSYEGLLENIDREAALQMIDMTRASLKKQVQLIEKRAEEQLPTLRSTCIAAMHSELDGELHRLITLQKNNPSIRDWEITQLKQKIEALEMRLSTSTLKLSALRVIYTH